jgi:putative ABC transport system permease protein
VIRFNPIAKVMGYIPEAFSAIWRNRTRSILTMLGMIIGTASIIAVLGISRAAAGGITGTLASFGDQGISVLVDPNSDDPRASAIQYRDARIVAGDLGPLVDHIEPAYQRTYTLRAGAVTTTTTIYSGSDFHPDSLMLREGRRIERDDVASAAHVCLLTGPLADHLFAGVSALGRVVTVSGTRCTVIGVYAEIKGGLFNSIGGNEAIELPYPTLHDAAPGPVDALTVYAGASVTPGEASDAIVAVLRRLHGTRAQYRMLDSDALMQGFNQVLSIVALGLTGIGGVALVVAGIGIMNIMLVSVTERTREIGLRKAIGATRGDVALQFLLEAVLLSFMGGGVGTVLGFAATLLAYSSVEALVGPAPIPYLLIVSVAVGFSTLVGCVFGTYPAIRAARLDPIAALRS